MKLQGFTHICNSCAPHLCVRRDAYDRYACVRDTYALLWCHTYKRVSHTNEHLVYLVCPCLPSDKDKRLPSRINTNPSYRCKLHVTHIVVSCHTHERAMPHSRKHPLCTYRTASLKVNTAVKTHSYVRHKSLRYVMKCHWSETGRLQVGIGVLIGDALP